MAIQVVTTEQSTLFTIRTKHTTYQMKADEYGVLLHLWYGASVEGDMSYLLDYPDVGFSGHLYEAENRRTYSLNTLPLEYATEGVGDFRIPAVAATPCRRQQCIRFAVSVLQHSERQICDCRASGSLCRRRRSRNFGNCSERYGNRFAGNLAVWRSAGTGYADSLCFHPESWHNADYTDKGSQLLFGFALWKVGMDALPWQTCDGTDYRTDTADSWHSGKFQHKRHIQPPPEPDCHSLHARLHGNQWQLFRSSILV